MVCRPAETSFDDVADTELLRNFFEIAGIAGLILHYRSAADYFQLFDLGQIGEQLFLNAVGKVGVLLFLTQIVQRKDGNAFVRNSCYFDLVGKSRHSALLPQPKSECETEQQEERS